VPIILKQLAMKWICIIIIIPLFGIRLNGQIYKSCIGENTKWTEIAQDEYPIEFDIEVSGDTIINNLNYKTTSGQYQFGLRQDTSNSKLYIINLNYPLDEFLIMDLTLELNDTFRIESFQTDAIVDSIYEIDDRKVIRFNYFIFNYKNENEKFKFIEGIGSNMGITFPLALFMRDTPYLLCFKNNSTSYMSEFYDSCTYSYFIDNLFKDKSIISDQLLVNNLINDFIELKYPITGKISIYGISGTAVKGKSITDNKVIDFRNYPSGFYILYCIDNQGNLYKQKFIKINQ